MKLGIIGAGVIVQEFLPKLTKLEGLQVCGILDTPRGLENTRKFAQDNGVQFVTSDFEELCEKTGIDTIYVAVPNSLHYDYCKRGMEKGLNVIVEKPLASNSKEAKELKALSEKNDVFLFEAITTIYFDAYKKIREWLKEIGTVKLVQCNYSQYSRRYDAFRNGEVLPVFDPKKSGGAMMDLNLYNLFFVAGLFGAPESYRYYANIERGIDTSGTLIMRYDGFVVSLTAAKDCSAPYFFVIEGTDGYITTEYSPNLIGKICFHRNDQSEESYEDGMAKQRLIPEFAYFIDAINRNDKESCRKNLELSLLVSEIQTNARMQEGIVFPCDK